MTTHEYATRLVRAATEGKADRTAALIALDTELDYAVQNGGCSSRYEWEAYIEACRIARRLIAVG